MAEGVTGGTPCRRVPGVARKPLSRRGLAAFSVHTKTYSELESLSGTKATRQSEFRILQTIRLVPTKRPIVFIGL